MFKSYISFPIPEKHNESIFIAGSDKWGLEAMCDNWQTLFCDSKHISAREFPKMGVKLWTK